MRETREPLPASSCILLADHLQIRLDALMSGRIDYAALEKQVNGGGDALPERYSVGTFSRRRTSLHLIDYCDQHIGWDFTDRMLKTLQLRRAAFSDPDAMICMTAPVDLSDMIGQVTGDMKLLFNAGANSLKVNKNSPFADAIRKSGSIRRAYELLFTELMGFFDAKNHVYWITHIDDSSCTFESKCHDELTDTLKVSKVGSTYTCATRAGVAAAVAGFLGAPLPYVVESQCQHRGDPVCRFHIHYEFANRFLRRQAANGVAGVARPSF
jgi:hypothetical protein